MLGELFCLKKYKQEKLEEGFEQSIAGKLYGERIITVDKIVTYFLKLNRNVCHTSIPRTLNPSQRIL